MADITFDDKFQAQANWWLPNDPDKVLAGTIEWLERKAEVELNGSFLEFPDTLTTEAPPTYQAVHGKSKTGDLIALLRANTSRRQFNFGASGLANSQTLRAHCVAIGAHVDPETRYSELRVRVPGLNTWLCRTAIRQEMIRAPGSPARMTYHVEGLPEEVVQSAEHEIGFAIRVALGTPVGGNVTISSSGWLRIAGKEPQTLEWLLGRMSAITTLLTLVSGAAMNPDSAAAEVASNRGDVKLLLDLQNSKTCSFVAPHDFFLLRQNLGISLEALVTGWLDKYERLQMPAQLAQSVLTADSLWSHVEFLSLMQALEGLHRAQYAGTYVSPKDYEPIKEALTAAIPASAGADHKASLKSRIKFGNEISLAKRLAELVKGLDDDVRKRLLGGDGQLPRSWVDTRNYFTHWDEASREGILSPADMHYASVRLRLLLRTLFLCAAGIPQANIYKALEDGNKESQYLLQLNGAERVREP